MRRWSFYNEFDPQAAEWLRELMSENLIAPGYVDERSIKEVKADELGDFAQHHFFAGIGGWSAALGLAGWSDDRPVWTGSCPCQPYSSAGKQKGNADERNLWPDFFRLIRECRPDTVFGEQVSSAIRHGWLDGISADLEGSGYAVGAVVSGAHSVGAPHIRQRLWWVADAKGKGRSGVEPEREEGVSLGARSWGNSANNGLANTTSRQPGNEHLQRGGEHGRKPQDDGVAERLGNASCSEGPRFGLNGVQVLPVQETDRARESDPWADSLHLVCSDGKARRSPTQPSLFPLAYGLEHRVGLLRGAGNAIVPRAAAWFIEAFLETKAE